MRDPALPSPGLLTPTATSPDLQEQLLREAFLEFARLGFQRASLRRICGRVGVHHSNVHHLFGNKAGLLSAVVQDTFGSISRERMAAIDTLLRTRPHPSVAEIWDAWAIPTVRFYCHPDGVHRASLALRGITEHHAFWPSVKGIVQDLETRYVEALETALEVVPRGEVRLRYAAATSVFASGLITTTQNVDRPRPRTAEEIQRLRSYALAILHDPVGEHPGVSKLPKCYPVPTEPRPLSTDH